MKLYTIDNISDLGFKKAIRLPFEVEVVQIDEDFALKTDKGILPAKKGSYLIKGIDDELYICNESIYDKLYNIFLINNK